MESQEELILIQNAKDKREAFSQLYRKYVKRIYKYCYQQTGSRELAEDITSEVFTRSIEFIHKYNSSQGTFQAWLYRVAHNLIIDRFKKKSSSDISYEEYHDPSVGDTNTQIYERIQKTKQVAQVLQGLKGNYRQIISLKFFSGLSNGEISEVLDLKPSVMAVQLHRALEAFKKDFQKTFPESEIFDDIIRNN